MWNVDQVVDNAFFYLQGFQIQLVQELCYSSRFPFIISYDVASSTSLTDGGRIGRNCTTKSLEMRVFCVIMLTLSRDSNVVTLYVVDRTFVGLLTDC